MAVDIGAEASDRLSSQPGTQTIINRDHPATIAGKITSIDIWALALWDITGLRVGTFYTTNGNTLKCRDSETIAGTITAGSKVTKNVSIAVEIGDYIGCYFTGGRIEVDNTGFAGLWQELGEHIDPGDEATYDFFAGDAMSLGGYIPALFGGYVSTKEMRMVGSRRIYRITAQDYNILPTGQLVTKDFAAQTEQQMIDFLFSTYLSEIDTTTYVSSSGDTATLGWTRIPLNEVLDEIAKIYGREWYIDFNKKLHYFTPSIVGAPFELSSSPAPPAKIGYDNIQFGEDTTQVCNRVTVIGTGVNRERTSATSIAYYGREFYCKVVDENIDTNDWGDSVGEAVLAERAFGKGTGSLVCYQEGLVVGQKVKIYNFLRGIDDYYLIQGIKFNMLNKTTEKITVRFGAYSKDLIALLGQIKGLEEKE